MLGSNTWGTPERPHKAKGGNRVGAGEPRNTHTLQPTWHKTRWEPGVRSGGSPGLCPFALLGLNRELGQKKTPMSLPPLQLGDPWQGSYAEMAIGVRNKGGPKILTDQIYKPIDTSVKILNLFLSTQHYLWR